MVPFAGWDMPVQYSDLSIIQSHLYTREKASLFDVSHMLQSRLKGKDRVKFMETLIVGDLEGLAEDRSMLSLFTDEKGGIMDDLVVTKTCLDHLYVVSNAGCADKDFKHMDDKCREFVGKGNDVMLEKMDASLVAVQGPATATVLQAHTDLDLSQMPFMSSRLGRLFDVEGIRFTRCGYTGEDGFELCIPNESVVHLTEMLLQADNQTIKLAGLGARDSLRLEAGLCLYGSDIDEGTTPVEATLAWTIGKRRRSLADFPGADIILAQLKNKPLRKRVGLISTGPPARAHAPIWDSSEKNIVGEVTSGCPSPCLHHNVAMAYVKTSVLKEKEFKVEVRKKKYPCSIAKMPFVPSRYYALK